MSARQTYRHLVNGDIMGVRTRIKTEKKNPNRKRYQRKRRR